MTDGKRIAGLLNYIQEKAGLEFLGVALLPKDAQSVEEAVYSEYTMLGFEPLSA